MPYTQKMAYNDEHSAQLEAEMSDRTEAAPLTTERRYGFYAMGCGAALVLIVIITGIGAILVIGLRGAGIMLAILLPVLVLAAVLANIFLWYQHKRAIRQREIAANEWGSTTYAGQIETSASSDIQRNSDSWSWFRRFSQRTSNQSTPPPGYQTVVGSTS